MTSTLNPRAKEFIPKTDQQLHTLSATLAESVLIPSCPSSVIIHNHWNGISKIDFPLLNLLRKVATIHYLTKDITVNLYWDNARNRAIVDIPIRDFSWELSNRTIRNLIHLIFIEDVQIINEDPQLDILVSEAPILHIDVKAIEYVKRM